MLLCVDTQRLSTLLPRRLANGSEKKTWWVVSGDLSRWIARLRFTARRYDNCRDPNNNCARPLWVLHPKSQLDCRREIVYSFSTLEKPPSTFSFAFQPLPPSTKTTAFCYGKWMTLNLTETTTRRYRLAPFHPKFHPSSSSNFNWEFLPTKATRFDKDVPREIPVSGCPVTVYSSSSLGSWKNPVLTLCWKRLEKLPSLATSPATVRIAKLWNFSSPKLYSI